ncbi:competence/damage-inducible protein A [bacterium]|nr:competence/damage-inducible protein A [bacterium]
MLAEIISVGDELLNGATVNTNAAFIGDHLNRSGLETAWISVCGDHAERMRLMIGTAVERAGVVVITGGLGPTHDDITKVVVAEIFGMPLEFRQEIYTRLEHFFKSRGRRMSPLNEVQAEIPSGADVIENQLGTAPGLYIHRHHTHVFVLPGVPREMERMLLEYVIPALNQLRLNRPALSRTLHTIGISESELNESLSTFRDQYPDIRLASLPNYQGVSLRLSLQSEEAGAPRLFEEAVQMVRETAGLFCFGEEDETLEQVVGGLLLGKNWTLSVAESCTGGLIAHRLTNVPGSSAYFERGLVAYSNQSKTEMLSVPAGLLRQHGAVSAETALAMAKGIRQSSGTDVGLSITGIAGPGGGTKEKPVGLVYIGYADPVRTDTQKYYLGSDRLMNKSRSAGYALDFVRRMLQDSA